MLWCVKTHCEYKSKQTHSYLLWHEVDKLLKKLDSLRRRKLFESQPSVFFFIVTNVITLLCKGKCQDARPNYCMASSLGWWSAAAYPPTTWPSRNMSSGCQTSLSSSLLQSLPLLLSSGAQRLSSHRIHLCYTGWRWKSLIFPSFHYMMQSNRPPHHFRAHFHDVEYFTDTDI